jgi:hypothetical protein
MITSEEGNLQKEDTKDAIIKKCLELAIQMVEVRFAKHCLFIKVLEAVIYELCIKNCAYEKICNFLIDQCYFFGQIHCSKKWRKGKKEYEYVEKSRKPWSKINETLAVGYYTSLLAMQNHEDLTCGLSYFEKIKKSARKLDDLNPLVLLNTMKAIPPNFSSETLYESVDFLDWSAIMLLRMNEVEFTSLWTLEDQVFNAGTELLQSLELFRQAKENLKSFPPENRSVVIGNYYNKMRLMVSHSLKFVRALKVFESALVHCYSNIGKTIKQTTTDIELYDGDINVFSKWSSGFLPDMQNDPARVISKIDAIMEYYSL